MRQEDVGEWATTLFAVALMLAVGTFFVAGAIWALRMALS